jgi:hypothetical protein
LEGVKPMTAVDDTLGRIASRRKHGMGRTLISASHDLVMYRELDLSMTKSPAAHSAVTP